MRARQKLNSAYFLGSLGVASLVGWSLRSWLVFLVAVVVLVGINLHNGEIRPDKRRRR